MNYQNKMNSGEFLAKEPMTEAMSISTGINIASNILSIIR